MATDSEDRTQNAASVRIDLHVHSKFSKRPSQWVLKKLGCPESFTDPHNIYRIAKAKGMDLVTITDHNTIDGVLEIAHLPDVFISEEITTYFPEDGCKVHVLAYGITERHHGEIQKIRENIFDLAAYLRSERIVHAVAHPLYGVNERLTAAHFEKMLLLFRRFELNGAREAGQNQIVRTIVADLGPEQLDRLAETHAIMPLFPLPWKKQLIAGSDDHSGLNIARSHTRVDGGPTVEGVLAAIAEGRCEPMERSSTPRTLAHNLYGIAYQYYRNRFGLGRYVNRDILLKYLERSLNSDPEAEGGLLSRLQVFWNYRRRPRVSTEISNGLMEMLRQETWRFLRENPALLKPAKPGDPSAEGGDPETRWFDFVNQVSNKVMCSFANHLMGHLSGANVFNIFHTIGAAGGLYTLLAPYFVSFVHFTKDRKMNGEILHRFQDPVAETLGDRAGRTRVAHFTDTFYEVNGVAQTLQQQVEIARRTGKDLTVITCDAADHLDRPGVTNFKPVGRWELPEYPELQVFYPPFLEMLNHCHEQGFTHIHSATPGPIGLAALGIAHILNLPINGTYHTALPQYAQYLTGDSAIEELTWRYTLWYYDQMDAVYVPSRATGDELIAKGLNPEKIRLFPRGIDTARFHPAKRNGVMKKRFGIGGEIVKLLYVGRVSKEKNMPLLAQAFKALLAETQDIHLFIVGDGPYLEEMKRTMAGTPCTFTGYMDGEPLATMYASSDIFVFPSTTDTFGNVVLEAQAAGLPVIVTDQGGPHENMLSDRTGLVVKGDDPESLGRAMRILAGDRGLARSMGASARRYMEDRSFEQAFDETWRMYDEDPARRRAG